METEMETEMQTHSLLIRSAVVAHSASALEVAVPFEFCYCSVCLNQSSSLASEL